MKNLPKAKGVLEASVGKEERKEQRIGEITKMVMGQIPEGVLKPSMPPSNFDAPALRMDEEDLAETETAQATKPNYSAPSKKDLIAETIVETGRAYQDEATRVAQINRSEELVRQTQQRKAAKTKMPTSIWIPESAKKNILALNTRTFDYEVKINLRGLVLYALKTLHTMPDGKIAEIMKEFDVDERRKANEDDE